MRILLIGADLFLSHSNFGKAVRLHSDEIRVVMNTEVSLVILLDGERNEFSYMGVAHDSSATEKRIREFRFPADKRNAGKVGRTGKPVIVSDPSREPYSYPEIGQKIG